MPEPVHKVRNSLIDQTRVFRLDDEGLSWHDGTKEDRRRYADIAAVHLISYPGYGGRHLQCTLTDRAGKKTKIRSHHYASLGNFEDRSQSYGTLIRELAERLDAQGANVSFRQGSRMMRAVWIAIFGLGVVVLIGYALALLGGAGLSLKAAMPIVVLAVLLPLAWSMIGNSYAGSFDPKAPPPELLGGL